MGSALYYAFRVTGPDPGPGFNWHALDPEKLLLDPYASSVYFPPGFSRAAAAHPGSNTGKAPLGVLRDVRCDCVYDRKDDGAQRHESDRVIYEMHVRGFTRHPNSGVSEGRFRALSKKFPICRNWG